jgi:hypothetical protein
LRDAQFSAKCTERPAASSRKGSVLPGENVAKKQPLDRIFARARIELRAIEQHGCTSEIGARRKLKASRRKERSRSRLNGAHVRTSLVHYESAA